MTCTEISADKGSECHLVYERSKTKKGGGGAHGIMHANTSVDFCAALISKVSLVWGKKEERNKSSAESNLLRNEAVKHDGRPLAVFSAQASKPALLFNNASVPALLVPGRDGGWVGGGAGVCVRV